MEENNETGASTAVATLYHAWLTGIILGLVTHRGRELAEKFVFRLFRHQHHERFLPGLKKLGLDELPHAVACAKYHYLSNQIGGVKVEYLAESERKAWVRYPPARWIFPASTICAIPANVNHAMLYGWHAHNGVTLGNPRLGFVCTGTTVDGAPGLEGYYLEHGRPLADNERLRFAPDEHCPPIDIGALPTLDFNVWPALRQAKAYRNYSMEYIRNGLPILIELLGAEDAGAFAKRCGRQVGMQYYDDIARLIGVEGSDAKTFLGMLAQLLSASGDEVEFDGDSLKRRAWRLFPHGQSDENLLRLWRAPFEGLLAVHNRFLSMRVGDGNFSVVDNFPHTARLR